jgi:hypothetical protein
VTAKKRDIEHLPTWPRLLSRPQAAAYCGLSPSAFDSHFFHRLNPIRFGRTVRFDRLMIDSVIDSLPLLDAELMAVTERSLAPAKDAALREL